ncbi:MAG TPA: holdfast anchoring protein HfaB [Rhizomicrobium sp.]|jgi:curli biogenesis system outer membrane secretion channel CsgG|nr:holdfast anchoring protein HfaB [Rhizomicrobium sp.]
MTSNLTPRGKRHFVKPLVFVLATIALAGCIGTSADDTGRYTAPIGGSPVIGNETPYSVALRCFSRYTAGRPLRVAVGQIADYTGKYESDNSGRKLTQGAALMAMSALAKAGVPMVERYDTSVAEMELKYANNKLIGDDKAQPEAGPSPAPAGGDYRKIFAGSIPGSNYYIVGGITELNFNIRSAGADIDGGETSSSGVKGTSGANVYVMNVGLDLRLVDTDTLEVVDVVSYQKQIIGHQIQAGIFDFLGHYFADASAGESALEPIQLAVRSVIERAVLQMVTRLYHTPADACTSGLGGEGDPLAGPDDNNQPPLPAHTASINTPITEEKRNDTSHQDPYRFYGASDPSAQPSLRGRVD